MRIRFLQTTRSENPNFPFQAGQVIDVPAPSPFLLSLLDGVRAEVIKDTEPEYAVARAVNTVKRVTRRRKLQGSTPTTSRRRSRKN
jgi:hypothetical protein